MARRLISGTHVGPYTVKSVFGFGSEGDVYEAVNALGRTVALKQLKGSASHPANKDTLERALRLRDLIGLHSPYVCDTYAVFIEDDLLYVAMEYVPGRSLERLLKEEGPLLWEVLVPVMGDVLAGLGWLHGQDIVHRDVKPANIIFTGGKGGTRAKLIDLGIVLVRRLPRITCKGAFLATREYMAPEVLKGEEIDGRADLYSLGVTLFELLTGSLPLCDPGWPIRRTFVKELIDPIRPSVRDLDDTIPEPIDGFIQHLMAVRPGDRPSTAAAAWEELQWVVKESGATLPPPDSPIRGPIARSHAAVPNLVIQSGPLAGTAISIPKNGLTLGRAALNPGDTHISRFHIRVRPTKRGLVVRDQRSLNGLIYRGKRLRRVVLPSGESLLVGETTVRFSE